MRGEKIYRHEDTTCRPANSTVAMTAKDYILQSSVILLVHSCEYLSPTTTVQPAVKWLTSVWLQVKINSKKLSDNAAGFQTNMVITSLNRITQLMPGHVGHIMHYKQSDYSKVMRFHLYTIQMNISCLLEYDNHIDPAEFYGYTG